ncbi:hypothetical protein D920_00717 [Enterococcus faecalis 13-SD-W-01]|nr:hypothetical protein D920_00717 [Enterococcus faecalis 13-SD-W-01]
MYQNKKANLLIEQKGAGRLRSQLLFSFDKSLIFSSYSSLFFLVSFYIMRLLN